MILPWLAAVLDGRNDIALILDESPDGGHFDLVKCFEESDGIEANGFSCIFAPMPHVCVFRTIKVDARSMFRLDPPMKFVRMTPLSFAEEYLFTWSIVRDFKLLLSVFSIV